MSDYDDGFSLKQEMEAFGDDLLGKAYPTGEYDMLVRKAVPAKTAGGKHCVKATLEFIGGPMKGKTVPDQLNWSPESDIAARIFAQSMSRMGATQEWIKATNPSMVQLAAKIQGAKVHVKLTEDTWNGMPRNKISYLSTISLGGGGGGGAGNGGVSMAQGEAEDLTAPDSSDAVSLSNGDDDWP